MIDYRIAKKQGGFNLQRLYTDILKSKTTDRWYMQKHGDKTLIANYGGLYIVPGKFPLASGFIEESRVLKDLVPNWDSGVPCVYANPEVALTDKTVVKVFRKGKEDFYFNIDFFKYFTTDTFEYRMSDRGKSLYIAYNGELIAMILGINVSK